ncbi:hypothetical protein PFISCL1PPCAC_27750, partial [Pristionchus fissidentatus]
SRLSRIHRLRARILRRVRECLVWREWRDGERASRLEGSLMWTKTTSMITSDAKKVESRSKVKMHATSNTFKDVEEESAASLKGEHECHIRKGPMNVQEL